MTIGDFCPLCDRIIAPRMQKNFHGLPQTTEQTLVELYRRIWPYTSPSPREGNADARSVLVGDSKKRGYELLGEVCTQHRYETFYLPLSLQLQLPRSIDFNRLSKRMVNGSMRTCILSIFESPWLSCAFRQDLNLRPSYRAATLKARLQRSDEIVCAG